MMLFTIAKALGVKIPVHTVVPEEEDFYLLETLVVTKALVCLTSYKLNVRYYYKQTH